LEKLQVLTSFLPPSETAARRLLMALNSRHTQMESGEFHSCGCGFLDSCCNLPFLYKLSFLVSFRSKLRLHTFLNSLWQIYSQSVPRPRSRPAPGAVIGCKPGKWPPTLSSLTDTPLQELYQQALELQPHLVAVAKRCSLHASLLGTLTSLIIHGVYLQCV
jgi:hypothetical protein